MTEADLALDREVAQLCGLMPLLGMVTPVNVDEAREAFFAGSEPEFRYRTLPDLDALQERLESVEPESAEDPTVAVMLQALVHELTLRLEMFRNRGEEAFFLSSVEMFGHVTEPLLDLANDILDTAAEDNPDDDQVGAAEFLAAAQSELEHYRSSYPEMTASARLSASRPGLMVETGVLHIGDSATFSRRRVDQLVQHEVGTHIVTYENGKAQPLQVLGLGLAGYDELQEALGVLAEHLTGDLPMSRLRVLAYRVVAAHMRAEGADFRETHDHLVSLGCGEGASFMTTMRAFRSGGMTKDIIYLRGLARLLGHLRNRGDLESLYVGKISFDAIPMVTELRERDVVTEPPLHPRFLTFEGARSRLEAVRSGEGVLDLIGTRV